MKRWGKIAVIVGIALLAQLVLIPVGRDAWIDCRMNAAQSEHDRDMIYRQDLDRRLRERGSHLVMPPTSAPATQPDDD